MSLLEVVSPEILGLDSGPLKLLRQELREKINAHGLPGYVLCVSRNQQPVFVDVYGLRDIERKGPVELDTIFRQFSMTKAIVSVAAMTFFDEGRFQLDDPISKFLGDAWLPAVAVTEGGSNNVGVGLQASGIHVVEGGGFADGSPGEIEDHRVISNGNIVFLRARHTNNHVDIDPAGLGRCRWDDRGEWQGLSVQNLEPSPLNPQILRVALQAHTGNFIGVSEGCVVADCAAPSTWIIQVRRSEPTKKSHGALFAGDILQLKHELTSLWLCVKGALAGEKDDSLGMSLDLTSASEFILEKQTFVVSLVPARRPITIRNLLTHTSGLDYAGMGQKAITPLDAIVKPLVERCQRDEVVSLEAWVAEMAKLPLSCQPGTGFTYGYSTDVLGRVVEVLGNAPLDQVLQERVFTPLGMTSTSFGVSPHDAEHRLAALYEFCLDYGKRELRDDPLSSLWVPPKGPAPIFGAGGGVESLRGGLVSTVPDYLLFLHMLLGGGKLDGVRVLSSSTVKLMTEVNHLSFAAGCNSKIFDGRGYNLLGSIELSDPSFLNNPSHNPGNYGWGGWGSTTFRVNPVAGLAYVFMTNCIHTSYFEELILERLGESLHGKTSKERSWRRFLHQPVLVPALFVAVVLGTFAVPFVSRIFHANRIASRSLA